MTTQEWKKEFDELSGKSYEGLCVDHFCEEIEYDEGTPFLDKEKVAKFIEKTLTSQRKEWEAKVLDALPIVCSEGAEHACGWNNCLDMAKFRIEMLLSKEE